MTSMPDPERTRPGAATRPPYPALYAEALAAREAHHGRLATRTWATRYTDAELRAYVANVLARRPDAWCTYERDVAWWLRGIRCSADRWWRTWQVVASLVAAGRLAEL